MNSCCRKLSRSKSKHEKEKGELDREALSQISVRDKLIEEEEAQVGSVSTCKIKSRSGIKYHITLLEYLLLEVGVWYFQTVN